MTNPKILVTSAAGNTGIQNPSEKVMKTNNIAQSIVLATLMALPLAATAAESITGRLVGHSCTHEGDVCATDKQDPHLSLEPDFVLELSNGEHYFMPNLSRYMKLRYVLDTVTVTGNVDKQRNAIDVDELIVADGSKQRTAWSKKAERDAYASLTRIPGR